MSDRPGPRRGIARAVALGWGMVVLLTGAAAVRAQVGPEESARRLKPAAGLKASLWAAEPRVVNPTNIDVDSRGRVWVTEGLNYRLTRGGNRKFPRQGDADRVKILEDTDGDGKADKVTVFADKIFPVPMGIAVEERYGPDGKYQGCRVYIGNSPDLLVLEDTDGDDKADKRYPLLTGFGGVDSDHGIHGMFLALDGKLYFTHGDGCCSVQPDRSEQTRNFNVTDRSGRHVWSDQLANTLRVDRDGTNFEIISDRQRNNYETCLNSFGNGFTSDNDDDGNRGCRVIWVMDGGHYGYRTPGSPRHWGEDVPGNVPKLIGTGNGSPCGIMAYEGTLLPPEYRGGLFEAEAGTRQINFFPLTRRGASFRTESKVLLASDDPWFRPVDMAAAPDGSIIVADWYDAGVGGHAFADQTTGRIYRVVPKGSKPRKIAPDFKSLEGLIAALKSPNVATQDAARRSLIARGAAAVGPLKEVFQGDDPIDRARALWVLHAIEGDAVAVAALEDRNPAIREQAVRILGRDDARNGHVERPGGQAVPAPRALKNLNVLMPLVSDKDPGVRRELILAFRDLPTGDVGEALKGLAQWWDGQDRWYLEALGLALRGREVIYLNNLLDGTLYGDLKLEESGTDSRVALPPYFPVDRNEAFLAVGEEDLPANALSRTLGLAWGLRRVEALPLLIGRVLPKLATPELQQAADDILTQINDPAAAGAIAKFAQDRELDPARRRHYFELLARRLDGAWRAARDHPDVLGAIEQALNDPEMRPQGIAMAAATGDASYGGRLIRIVEDPKASADDRAAAVEALARLRAPRAAAVIDGEIARARASKVSDPVAEAAVRALPRLGDARDKLAAILGDEGLPLGLRREALRGFAQVRGGGDRLLEMARSKTLPEALRTEAATALRSHPDGRIRHQAAEILPLTTAGGKPLPPIAELLGRDGDAGHGRSVFFREGRNSCGSCHRVQGQGHWIGPDLSTIGSKYGKDELLRSVLNPSAAIAYNFHSLIVALGDGRVMTGLPVVDDGERLILKTAEGDRINLRPAEVEDRRLSEVSLMPEGLAQDLKESDLIDLLGFLTTLKEPVSIVGEFRALGPLVEEKETPLIDPSAPIDPSKPVPLADGKSIEWRRVLADAEGRVELEPIVGPDPGRSAYLYAPVIAPAETTARLVLDSGAAVRAWLGGTRLELPEAGAADRPRVVEVQVPRGVSALVLRVAGSKDASLVATFVAARPLEFSPAEATRARSESADR